VTDAYLTVTSSASARITRERSRFVALVFPAPTREEVEEALLRVRHKYHDAAHRPSAYRLFALPAPITHTDDDGEPAGSSGRPILREVEARDLYDVLAVVVRYFGGTKLGLGGLARAYADATREALTAAQIGTTERRLRLRITCPPDLLPVVLALVGRHGLRVERTAYGEVVASVAPTRLRRFREALTEGTGARAHCEEAS